MPSTSVNLEETTAPIRKVPPEMFSLIASNLPLQHLPSTLLALALTCRPIYLYVQPVLYTKVIIKDEDHATRLLERISSDPQLGQLIREFHLFVDFHTEAYKRESTTLLATLQKVVDKGCLPRMVFFRLVLSKFQYHERGIDPGFNDQYFLPRSFWVTLRRCCPLLQGLCVDGIEYSLQDTWEKDPDFYDLTDFLGLSTLTLKFRHWTPQKDCLEMLCRNIVNLASSLQSLTLFFHGTGVYDPSVLFSITFPHLKSFSISGFELKDTEKAMSFWKRHPLLQRLDLYTYSHHRWFTDTVESGLLPNLTHLMARFRDIRALATHLGQLEYLGVLFSSNRQVPHLLRSVLPDGLPKLKSLEIHQVLCATAVITSTEGAMWYETEGGEFLEDTEFERVYTYVDSSYILSILRGAPNIKELALHGFTFYANSFTQILPILGQLRYLERFYCTALGEVQKKMSKFFADDFMDDRMDDFILQCHQLGDSCPLLRTITNLSYHGSGPYRTANIIRECGGSVKEVVPGYGFGMEARGGDDDPFPDNDPFPW